MAKSRKVGHKTRKYIKKGSGTAPSKMVTKEETSDDIESGLSSSSLEYIRSNTPTVSFDYDPELGKFVSPSPSPTSSKPSSRSNSPLDLFKSFLKRSPTINNEPIDETYKNSINDLLEEENRTNAADEWNEWKTDFDESAKLESEEQARKIKEQARKIEEEVKKRKQEEEMNKMYQSDIESTMTSQSRNAEESKRTNSLCERITILREKGWNQFSSMVDNWCNENESKKNRGGRKKSKISKKRRHNRRKITRRK
jgi:hypothetical protein